MQHPIPRIQNVDEYNSLREELLALAERVDSAWRSGLFGIGAVAAAVLPQRELAQTVLCTEWSKFVALLVLCSVATGIAYLESREALRAERGADRIGGYLATFYDDPGFQSQDTINIGWHAWNRVEKEVVARKGQRGRCHTKNGEVESGERKRTPTQVTAAGTKCLTFVPVLFFFWVLMFVFVDAVSLSGKWLWMSELVGGLELVGSCIWLLLKRSCAAREAVEQTIRWYEIVRFSPELVEEHLKPWGRPRTPRRSQQADSPQV